MIKRQNIVSTPDSVLLNIEEALVEHLQKAKLKLGDSIGPVSFPSFTKVPWLCKRFNLEENMGWLSETSYL